MRVSISIGVICFGFVAVTAQSNVVKMQESSIRRVATKKPLPEYPASSLAKKSSGVAVAAIASNIQGQVVEVTVLEAPDEAIAAAVRAALLAWQIPPATVSGRTEPYGVRGKVTFYFQIAAGRGRVVNPEDVPGGPKPEPLSGPPSGPPGARGAAPAAAPTVVSHGEPVADIEISEADFHKLAASKPLVLDIREREEFKRGHRDGAINIPRDELPIRGYVEIDRTKTVVIDCAQTSTQTCHDAARSLLRGVKVKDVFVLLP